MKRILLTYDSVLSAEKRDLSRRLLKRPLREGSVRTPSYHALLGAARDYAEKLGWEGTEVVLLTEDGLKTLPRNMQDAAGEWAQMARYVQEHPDASAMPYAIDSGRYRKG